MGIDLLLSTSDLLKMYSVLETDWDRAAASVVGVAKEILQRVAFTIPNGKT